MSALNVADLPALTDSGERRPSPAPGKTAGIRNALGRDRRAPLSAAQQRLWALDRLGPDDPYLVVCEGFRLRGPLAAAVLAESLSDIAGRHEALRTGFAVVNGHPAALPAAAAVAWTVIDLADGGPGDREEAARRLAAEEARTPINLATGPLLRGKLVRIADDDHLLLLSMHRIVADSWSSRLLRQELSAFYGARVEGRPASLPTLLIQYGDFAAWQQQRLESGALASDLGYWTTRLEGSLPVLDLPADLPRAAVPAGPLAVASLRLSATLTGALETLSRRGGGALPVTLLAAFKVLLHRLTGDEDILVGYEASGRGHGPTRRLIGRFVNELLIRTPLGGSMRFDDLLGAVRDGVRGARLHRDVPVETVLQRLGRGPGLSLPPVHRAGFRIHDAAADTPLALTGLSVERFAAGPRRSELDLTLTVHERGEDIEIELAYRSDLFSAERVEEMLTQYRQLLRQVSVRPEAPLHAFSLVTPAARRRLPDPRAVIDEPRYPLVGERFAAWTGFADAPAIEHGGRTWTYGELAAQAGGVAQSLLVRRLAPGTVVAVAGAPGFALIAAMAGVFLAGGVLLTLDPRLPRPRQQVMIEEARARFLLHVGPLPPAHGWMRQSLDVIEIDREGTAPGGDPTALPLPQPGPDDPAYLFFTSGTTGVPKGVLGCHKGLAHFLAWQRQTFGIGPGDRAAQLTNVSFDVVLRDVFTPLTAGATLCIPAEDDRPDPHRLLAWLEREGITLLHTVPSVAQSWLAADPAGISLRRLRYAFFAGEPLPSPLVRRWRHHFPEAGDIINLYGPTETTLAKCWYRVPAEPVPGIQPVGMPMPETQALVLDARYQPCGIGEPGEIVLRTPFRSLGYINAAPDNHRRFVRNPFRHDESDIVYVTGDRGRYRPDGTLDILGRVDNQVKLRGVRIELRGIEASLAGHPAVREAVASVREDTPGDPRLVAYVTLAPQAAAGARDLQDFMRQRLPDAMVPSAIVILAALPLTANGKIDRRALPAPCPPSDAGARLAPPRSALEGLLSQVWQQVLRIDKVGIDCNFFDLGGHSLLMAEVQGRLRQLLARDVPVVALFQYPTIRALARYLGDAAGELLPRPGDQGRAQMRKDLMRQRRRVARGAGARESGQAADD